MSQEREAGYCAPKQGRSQRTLERILDTTEQLLISQRFSELSVNEICAAAGVSTSSFYARFPDRSALLHALFERFAENMRAQVDDFEACFRSRDGSFEDLVSGAIELYMRVYQSQRGLLGSFGEAERNDPVLLQRRRSLDEGILTRLREGCVRLNPRLAERGLGRAGEIAIPSLAAAIRGALERPSEFGDRAIHSRQALVAELTEVALRYLAVDGDETQEQG